MNLTSAVKILKNRYPRSTPGKYFAIAAVIVGILFVIGLAIKRNLDAEDTRLTDLATQQRVEREKQDKVLREKLAKLEITAREAGVLASTFEREASKSKLEILRLEGELEGNQVEIEALEDELSTASEEVIKKLLRTPLAVNLAKDIMVSVRKLYPMVTTEHLFFSATQENLFRTNPATAHLIYMALVAHPVKTQLISKLHGSLDLLTGQLEQSEKIVSLRSEELISMSSLVDDYQFTQESLEASLALDGRFIDTLEQQIAIMRKKNLFQRILPSLNVVLGPYYDPFRNTAGLGISLGLGWRF